MADERTMGVILRTRPLTESSLIVHWLTADLGRVATVAKGARRPKSAFRGKLDLFYEAEFSFQRSRRSELHTLREVALKQTHPGMRLDLSKLEAAAYVVALLEQGTETETPIPEFYELFLEALKELELRDPTPGLLLAFEFRMLELLGLAQELEQSGLSPGAQAIARHLSTSDSTQWHCVQLSPAQEAELRHFTGKALGMHLGRVPRTPTMLHRTHS